MDDLIVHPFSCKCFYSLGNLINIFEVVDFGTRGTELAREATLNNEKLNNFFYRLVGFGIRGTRLTTEAI